MSVLGTLFSAAVVAQIARTTVPYLLASAGGIVTERSGVINIALEGMMLVGAFACIVGELATASPFLGLAFALLIGAATGALHSLIVVKGRVHGVISGLAINLFALGGTRVLLRTLYRSTANSPSVTGIRFFEGNDGARTLLRALLHPTTLLAIALVVALPFALKKTNFGLALRASGDGPIAARALGINVPRTRIIASTVGGALAALGGASLALDQHQFQSAMTSGRGFIAVAIVILSAWRLERAFLYAAAFAAIDACQIVFQGAGQLVGDALTMLPYLVALATLTLSVAQKSARLSPPSGLGQAEE